MKLVTNNQQSDSEQISARISSMVDGELSPEGVREELPRLLSGGREREQWQHYHLVRDLLQRQLPEQIDPDFTQKVMKRLEKEPTVLAPISRGRTVVKQIMGVGLAASVATIALFSAYTLNTSDGTQPTQMVAQAKKPQATKLPKSVEQWKRAPELAQGKQNPDLEQFSSYLANHAAYSAGTGNQGFMPYARVVGYSNEK